MYNKQFLNIEYYHDDEMVTSFSYRVYQCLLFTVLAFLSTMLLCPPKDSWLRAHFEDFYDGFALIFYACVFMNVAMFFTFIVELTVYKPEIRHKVFKTELSKVFVAAIVFNLMAIIMTNWL